MPWTSIDADDVMEQFTPQEAASLQTIQGGSSNLPAILTKVIAMARAYILAGGNRLDAEGTIPDQFKIEVIDIARWKWLVSFPKLKALQTDERKEAYQEAMKTLKAVSKVNSEYRVELPATATAESNPSPVNTIKVVSGNHREFTRRKTQGL